MAETNNKNGLVIPHEFYLGAMDEVRDKALRRVAIGEKFGADNHNDNFRLAMENSPILKGMKLTGFREFLLELKGV